MKNLAFLIVFLFSLTASFAKDVSIKIVNSNTLSLTVWMGTISTKDNSYSDDEIVSLSKQLGIIPSKRKLGEGKNLQVNQKDLSNSSVFVMYGVFDGGGRTEIKRFYVKELEARLTINFDEIKVYKPNKSYYTIVQELEKTDDLGEGVVVKNIQMIGMFIFYDVMDTNNLDVYILRPSIKADVEELEKSSNEVSDFISKDAIAPFMNQDGKLVRKIPEETTDVFSEVTFPGYSSRAKLFGDKSYRFLTWSINNSQILQAKISDHKFLALYNSCSEADKKYVSRKFMAQVNKDVEASYHLTYVTIIRKADKIEIISSGYDALDENEELLDNDIKTSTGAFRLNDKKEVVFVQENMISYIKGHDITPLLYFMIAKNNKFAATEFEADNLLGLYRSIGDYVMLPELDEEITSIYEPAITVSKVKEVLNDPKILETIEGRLKEDMAVALPVQLLKSVDKKLEGK